MPLGLGGEEYKLPCAEYAPKHTSNTPCYFSNTLELVNSYVSSQMKHCLPEECVYSPQVATCMNAYEKCLRKYVDFVAEGNLKYELQGHSGVEICRVAHRCEK